jgi:hypothetical protein
LLAGFVGPYFQKNIEFGIAALNVNQIILNELAAGRGARRQLVEYYLVNIGFNS